MKYQEYIKIGCGIIGSGAIEFAHRILRKNNDWNKIMELTRAKFKAAA